MVDTFDCARAQIYHNTGKLTPAQIKAKTGCTHIINGYLFNGKFRPVGWTVIDGKVISRDKYQDWGVSIGSDGVPKMRTDRGGSFLSGVPILKGGSKLYRELTPDVARPAARTAVGWLANGKVVLWCDKTSLTREQLQNKLLGLGVVDALMLDGGGSTQGIFPGGKVTSSRKVPTLLLFWERSAIKPEDQALVWGKAHGLLTDANAGETVTRADMVRALYQIWGITMVEIHAYSKAASGGKQLSAHFKVREFACGDGSDAVLVAPRLVMVLETIRSHFCAPVVIHSAYRTPQYNAKVNGAAHSQHCYGMAADISVSGQKPETVAAFARSIMPDWGGVGVYDSFCHIDVREAKADWKG